MRKQVLIFAGAIVLTFAVIFGVGWLFKSAGTSGEDAASRKPSLGYEFIMKEYDGKIAVYKAGSNEPIRILDVYIVYLPEADKISLGEGIKIKDQEELNERIQDFTS